MLSADQVLAVLWRRRLIVVATFVAVLSSAAAVTFSLPDVYRTTSYLLVTSSDAAGSDFEASQVNQVLTKTYSELLQTRSMAEEVAEALPFSVSPAAVQKAVKISPLSQTQLIEVIAEASSPTRAQTMADTYARVFIDKSGALGGGSDRHTVTVAEPAALVDAPVRPRPKLYLLLGAILAGFVAIGTGILRDRFDQRLEIDGSTTELFGLPILARLSQSSTARRQTLAGRDERGSELPDHAREAFGLLLANIAFVNLGEHPRSLAVVSAGESEGKSTCCVGIGRAAREVGLNVLLVDGDLRRPGLSSMFGSGASDASSGFSSLLLPGVPLALGEVVVRDAESSLNLLPSGPLPPNPSALLAQHGLADFDRRAKLMFDLVVYDSPPLSYAVDASLLGAKAEGTLLVINVRSARRSTLLQAVEQLQRSQANVLGIVLNRVAASPDSSYYYKTPQTATGRVKGERSGDVAPGSTGRTAEWLRRSRH